MLTKFVPIGLIPTLNSVAFFQTQNAPNPFSAEALPQSPIGELMMLHKTP